MPKTIIQQITFICPTGLGNLNASCRFHRASDNLPPDNMCPTCKQVLVKSTNAEDKITMTVMGEEDIELEIEQEDQEREKSGKAKRTNAEKIAHREKRKQDIQQAILKAREHEDK